jgi:glycolate oxidase
VEEAFKEIFDEAIRLGGTITGEHGIGLAKKRWWPEATSDIARKVHHQLKHVLDPDGILNPGKFLE